MGSVSLLRYGSRHGRPFDFMWFRAARVAQRRRGGRGSAWRPHALRKEVRRCPTYFTVEHVRGIKECRVASRERLSLVSGSCMSALLVLCHFTVVVSPRLTPGPGVWQWTWGVFTLFSAVTHRGFAHLCANSPKQNIESRASKVYHPLGCGGLPRVCSPATTKG